MTDAAASQPAPIRIGCFASLCRGKLGDLLLDFSTRHPAVEIGVEEMTRAALVQALRAGSIDIAVLPDPPPAGLCSLTLWTETSVVALPAGHRLEGRERIGWQDLAGELFALSRGGGGPDLHRFLWQLLSGGAALPRSLIHDLPQDRLFARAASDGALVLTCGTAAGTGQVTRTLDARFAVSACWPPDPPAAAMALIDLLTVHYPAAA